MNILLLYPEFSETFWSLKHALRFLGKKAGTPPLGLLTVASLLPQSWPIRLIDLNVGRLTDADLAWADMAMVSAMVVQRDDARRVIQRCGDAGVRVVAGGPLFTGESASFSGVDHFVLNEAEDTLPRFLADLERGEPGFMYTADGFPDIRQSPIPRWELTAMDQYATMNIQYSRGCPYDCEFCNITALLGRAPRTKTASQLIGELDTLYGLGWRGAVFVVDDNFIGNRAQLKEEVLPAMIRWRQGRKDMPFNTEVSINLGDDPELMRLMVEAGFNTVFVGIETPDEQGLKECNKLQNRGRNLLESVRKIQRAGLEVQGGFILGFDSDTSSIFQRQIDFIQNSGIVTAMVGLLQAPFGTRLYKRMEESGRLNNEMSGDNTDGSTNIIPRMELQELREGHRDLLKQIYSPRMYYDRIITLFREFKRPKVGVRKDPAHYMAFLRSIYRLGILGSERVHYWRLLMWTLFHRPTLFPHAITKAIYGFHFRLMACSDS